MKTYKLLQLAAMVALMGAATGCADDALVQISQETEKPAASNGQTITIQASVGGDDSRVSYSEGESKLTLVWDAKDSFSVFNGLNAEKATTFTIDAGSEGSHKATFTGTPETAYQSGDMLYAVYPAVPEGTSLNDLLLDLSNQEGKLDSKYQFMYGSVEYDGENAAFEFRHLTSLVKMSLTFPDGVEKIKSVAVRAQEYNEWDPYRSQMTLNMEGGYLSAVEEGALEYVATADMDVVNHTLTLYMYQFDFTPFSVITAVDADGNEYGNSFVHKRLEAGKMYRLTAPMIPVVPFDGGDGTEQAPYEIANLAQWNSFAALVSINEKINDERSYIKAHYKMTADINLSESDVLYPAGVDLGFGGVLDGDGHKITGTMNMVGTNHINMGLFPNVNEGTIRNLHVDAIQGDIYEPGGDFGTIVGRMVRGWIYDCSVKMDITLTNAELIGGIVGRSIDQMFNLVEGCSYSGNIKNSKNSFSWNGGIIGHLGYDTQVRACYAEGSVVSPLYGGGLVGHMTSDAQLIGCWSNVIVDCGTSGGLVGQLNEFDTGSEAKLLINGCYYNYVTEDFPPCGNIDGDYASHYLVQNCGQIGENGKPTAEQIDMMNKALKEAGSKYSFDASGNPTITIVSGGTAGGTNFGNGGEF